MEAAVVIIYLLLQLPFGFPEEFQEKRDESKLGVQLQILGFPFTLQVGNVQHEGHVPAEALSPNKLKSGERQESSVANSVHTSILGKLFGLKLFRVEDKEAIQVETKQ